MRRVVVVGMHYTPVLGVIRSLGEAGYSPDLAYILRDRDEYKIVASSKYINKCIALPPNPTEIIQKLVATYQNEEAPILLPVDDFSVSVLINYQDKLYSFVMPDVWGELTISDIMNKSIQNRMAGIAGVQTIPEKKIFLKDDQIDLSDIEYPCFCKPLSSLSGNKHEMFKCENLDDLQRAIGELKKTNDERYLLVQKFVEIENEYDVSGISYKNNVSFGGLVKKLKVAGYNRGPTEYGQIVDLKEIDLCISCLERFIRSLNINGIFDIELFKTKTGFVFNELNFRPSGIIYAVTASGNNLLATYVDIVTGGKENMDCNNTKPVRFISEKVVFEDLLYRYIKISDYYRMNRESDLYMIKNVDDNIPYKRYKKLLLKKIVLKAFKRNANR